MADTGWRGAARKVPPTASAVFWNIVAGLLTVPLLAAILALWPHLLAVQGYIWIVFGMGAIGSVGWGWMLRRAHRARLDLQHTRDQLAAVQKQMAQITAAAPQVNQQREELGDRLRWMAKLEAMDTSLFGLLPGLLQQEDHDTALRLLFEKFLQDLVSSFDGAQVRAFILQRDPRKAARLTVAWACNMPAETVARTQFYISGPHVIKKQGVAGSAYRNKTLQLAHVTRDEARGSWHADHTSYIFLDQDHLKRPLLPYRTIVTVPIMLKHDTCAGVLCLDSLQPDLFDGRYVQEYLRLVGARIANVLRLHKQIVQQNRVRRPKPNLLPPDAGGVTLESKTTSG